MPNYVSNYGEDNADNDNDDGLQEVRDHEKGFRGLSTVPGPTGARARVLLALAKDELPTQSDLKKAGFIPSNGRTARDREDP